MSDFSRVMEMAIAGGGTPPGEDTMRSMDRPGLGEVADGPDYVQGPLYTPEEAEAMNAKAHAPAPAPKNGAPKHDRERSR